MCIRDRAWADAAHAHGLPLVIDNTVPTPYLCRVFDHGADIAVHAATKYMGCLLYTSRCV